MRKNVAAALEAVGIASISAGGFLYSVTVGLVVLGAGLVVFGLAVEKG